jgi:uncharacterized phosphosugar-binding protein
MRYLELLEGQLRTAFEGQSKALDQAASAIADALVGGHWIFLAGTGHSHLLALELFYRAGGLVRAVPILDEPLMLHRSASDSSGFERESGRAEELLGRYGVARGDVLFVISNSGRNAVPLELASGGRALGATVIALTSIRHSLAFESRHPSGRRLLEVADIVLDNAGVVGDAAVEVAREWTMGPTSTAVGTALLQALAAEGAARAIGRGWVPEIYASSNGAGEAGNRRHLAHAHAARMGRSQSTLRFGPPVSEGSN